MRLVKEADAQDMRDLLEMFKTLKRQRVAVQLYRFHKRGFLMRHILLFLEPEVMIKFNQVSQVFYEEHVPAVMPPFLTHIGKIIKTFDEGIPQEALEKYCKPEVIAKYKMLGPLRSQTIIDKALDWCPNRSYDKEVEYKEFTDEYGHKCWGMVLKGTDNVRHGFVREIDPEYGFIDEGHCQNGKFRGYCRIIDSDGQHKVGYCKDNKQVGEWIHYDASNNETYRHYWGGLSSDFESNEAESGDEQGESEISEDE